MADNVVGFIGYDKYEIILYLSRILFHLKKKILLIDYSETGALYHCISVPETLREENCYIDYRGIDFLQGHNIQQDIYNQYDDILIDFGFREYIPMMAQCNKIFYVTDLYLHNISRINALIHSHEISIDKYLIIKDVFDCKIKPEYILNQFDMVMNQNHIYILYMDSLDSKYRIQSQYNHSFNFVRISRQLKYFLKDIAKLMDNGIDDKFLNNAYRKAERGK